MEEIDAVGVVEEAEVVGDCGAIRRGVDAVYGVGY